jgi:hypothetical protein
MPMKAIVFTQYGSPDDLVLKEVPTPVPKDGEVLVRVYKDKVRVPLITSGTALIGFVGMSRRSKVG